MIADEACWERGCACHDSRDSPGVELVLKREWVGLTDEEITELRLKTFDAVATNYESYRAIEAKLKAKNDH
jgi:hypothetical protein